MLSLKKYKNSFLALLFISLTQSIYSQDVDSCSLWVDSVFSTMSDEERIGQLFVYNVPATTDSYTTKSLMNAVEKRKVGGLLFWNGSLESQAQLTNMAQAASKVPLFVTMDGEWGLAMRLKNALRYPKKMTLSALDDEELIYDLGAELGRQCNEMRIQIDFDPVLDVNLNPANPVINTRSFGENPVEITRKASIFIKGLHSKKVLAVGKHFPGHGDTFQDSHEELAIVTHDRAQLDTVDLYPYKHLGDSLLDGVMVGHIRVLSVDSTGTPASLSPVIVDSLLKKELGYGGLIFTDAMKMKAVSDLEGATVRALLAGNDIILDPMNLNKEVEAVISAVKSGQISIDLINEKCKKVLKYKYNCGLASYQPIETNGLEKRINTPEAKRLQAMLSKLSVTVFKNNDDFLPIKDLKDKKIALVSVGSDTYQTFKNTVALYDSVEFYSVTEETDSLEYASLDSILLEKDVVIMAIHNTQVSDSMLYPLCMDKEKLIQVYFISPYQAANYEMSVSRADACVMGYENLTQTQSACAQAIFGGLNTKGKMPIKVKDFCPKDKCFELSKFRLGYGVPEEVGMNSLVLNKIDSIAYDAIEKEATPGCQILVARRGEVVYQKSFGYYDYDNQVPVSNFDLYDLASVTKATSTLPMIMKLYDEGKLDLDAPIYHYSSDLKKTNKKDITITDLLYHEAGLPAYIPFYQAAIDMQSVGGDLMQTKKDTTYCLQVDKNYYANKNYQYKYDFIKKGPDDEHMLPVADSMYILNSFRRLVWESIKQVKLGESKHYVYSDLSFLILQNIAQRGAKESLNNYVVDEFYKDLGATSLGFLPLERFPKNRIVPTEVDSFLRMQTIQGYVHDQNAAFLGGVAGHAGLFGNANDLAKYYQMLLNGGVYGGKRYLSEKTVDIFTTKKSPNSRRLLGFDRHLVIHDPIADDGTFELYGHTGFTGTCVWVDKKNEMIYIFLSNRVNPHGWNKKLIEMNVRTKIEDVIYESMGK